MFVVPDDFWGPLVDGAVQSRIASLADRANEGLPTALEQTDDNAYIDEDDLMSTLEMKAFQQPGVPNFDFPDHPS